MRKIPPRVWIAIALFAAGIVLVSCGCWVRHKVHDQADSGFDLSAFGLGQLNPYREILEKDLLVDATFTGVIRKEGELYSTYDRTQIRGKRACPS